MTMMDRLVEAAQSAEPDQRIEYPREVVTAILQELSVIATSKDGVRNLVDAILAEGNPGEGRPSLSPTDIALRDARNRLHLCTTMLKGLGPSHDLREHYASLVELTKAEIAGLEGRPSSTPEEDKARKEEILKELKALGSEYRGSFSSSFETWNARHEALTAELRDVQARLDGN